MKGWFNKLTNVSGLLESKTVLYFLVIISIINMVTYASTNEPTYAGYMLLIGFLTSFFSKNMIVIMFVAIAFTNIIRFGMISSAQYREGFDMEGINKLTKHLTESSDASESNENTADQLKEFQQKSTDAIDSQLEELIQTIDSSGMMDQMDKALDQNMIQEAKNKLAEALSHIDKISNEEQREKVKSILDVQIKLVDYLAGISPLVGEFKLALNSIKK
jgi:DNA-binding transcriptional MerR regulator